MTGASIAETWTSGQDDELRTAGPFHATWSGFMALVEKKAGGARIIGIAIGFDIQNVSIAIPMAIAIEQGGLDVSDFSEKG